MLKWTIRLRWKGQTIEIEFEVGLNLSRSRGEGCANTPSHSFTLFKFAGFRMGLIAGAWGHGDAAPATPGFPAYR
jgi:hypothetical protein